MVRFDLPHVADDAKLLNELAAAYDKVGDIWGGHGGESWGKTDIALANYQTALAMRQTLLDTGPPDDRLRYQMAVSRKRIGDVLRFTGDLGGALKGYRAFLDVTEWLRDTPKYRRGYPVALGWVGWETVFDARQNASHVILRTAGPKDLPGG